MVSKVQKELAKAERYLYPKRLSLIFTNDKHTLGKSNGGWADKRDHLLCLNMTQKTDFR